MAHHRAIPADFRSVLETTRLDLLALFRALDQLDLSAQQIPQRELRALMELDADLAEALWVLEQSRGRFDLQMMVRDTYASLNRLAALRPQFLLRLPPRAQQPLADHIHTIRASLPPKDAYHSIPRGDPSSR
jgi:hypothetical protein